MNNLVYNLILREMRSDEISWKEKKNSWNKAELFHHTHKISPSL